MRIKPVIFVAGLAGAAACLSGTAHADWGGWGRWHHPGPIVSFGVALPPPVYYAPPPPPVYRAPPPPVAYYPPPVYYAPPVVSFGVSIPVR
jgi:hypothetical protein